MARHGHFTPAADLLRAKIREIGEQRGFAATRLLTHWAEIVGESTAAIARPIGVSHNRRKPGEGATLTLLAIGAAALRLEMDKERIRERVNACYGYNAIARIRIQQTGAQAFAETGALTTRPAARPAPPDPGALSRAEPLAKDVSNTELRLALAALAANVLSRTRP